MKNPKLQEKQKQCFFYVIAKKFFTIYAINKYSVLFRVFIFPISKQNRNFSKIAYFETVIRKISNKKTSFIDLIISQI